MFRNILIGIDDRDDGRDACALARRLAEKSAALTLVRVHGAYPLVAAGVMGSPRTAERRAAKALLARASRAQDITGTLAIGAPSVAHGLIAAARERHSDLVVLGSRYGALPGFIECDDWLMRQLREAPCAVAVAPKAYVSRAHTIQRIGVLHSGSEDSLRALVLSRRLASSCDATLKVYEGVSTHEFGAHGESWHPGVWLGRESEHLDLVVVSATVTSPLRRRLHPGLSRSVMHGARTPLLTVPANAVISAWGEGTPREIWTNAIAQEEVSTR